MKKIIDGKIYDTEKAEKITGESYSTRGDFHHTFQDLYMTKKGTYFFHGGGGPMTDYAIALGNNSTGGSENIWLPENEDEVQNWVAKVDVDKAVELWPDKFEEA